MNTKVKRTIKIEIETCYCEPKERISTELHREHLIDLLRLAGNNYIEKYSVVVEDHEEGV